MESHPSTMDLPSGDPWDWSIDQVVEALCTKTNWWQGAFPNSSLPEPGSLEVALRENETNGFTLLSYVDDRILKSDFGLKAVARRAAVRCAIGWLRNQSSKYADYMSSQKSLAHGESLAEHSVAKQNCESNRFDSLMQEEDPTPLTAAALARHDKLERVHDRPRETHIVDARGQKRRRLVLNDANKEPQDSTTFDFNKKLTVDQLFYGATDFGGLLGDDKNFSISQMSNPHPVAAQYVNRQFIYFINKSKRESVGDSRQAVAVYPYKEQFEPENQPRSATLFRITGNQVQASREDASHLHVASKNRRLPNAPNGFSDGKDDEDGVLPVYGDSDEEDGYSPSLLEEMEADRQEDEALGLSKHLTKEKVLSIIEDRVQEFVGLWKAKKLPLRERTARAVWRKPKRRSDRILLIMEARRVIAHISRRLEKLKEALLADPWSSEGDIRKQCAVLEESVVEIEEQSWRASVWERAAEPPPPVGKTVAKRTPAARKKPRIPPVGDEAGDLVNSESELEADSDGLDDFISNDEEMAGWSSLPNQQPASPLRLPSGDSVLNAGDDDASMGEADDPMDVDPTQEGDEMSDIQETAPFNQGRVSSERRTWAAKSVPGGQSPPRSEPSTVVDLACTSPVASPSPVDVETPISQHVKTNGLSSHFTTLTEEDLAELTQDEVSAWDTQKLEERGDRKRLLVQIIRLYLGEDQLKIMKGNTTMTPAEWQRLVWGSIKLIAQKQRDKEASAKNWLAAQQYVKLYTCWVTGRASFWMDPVLQAAQLLEDLGDYSEEARKNTHACWKFLRSVLAATPDDCAGIANSRKRTVQKDSHGAVLRQDARERQKVQAQNERLYEQRMTSLQPSSTSGIPINIGKRKDQGEICIPPHIATRIKPHQTSGIRFMWREIIEAGQGCLLAHTMGLGKTMQAITFLVAITQAALSSDDRVSSQIPEHLQTPRYLIICPASLITNWLNELKLWIPPDCSYMIGDIRSIESDTPRGDRGRLIQLWNGTGGILVIGYEMFVSLVKPAAKSATTSTDQETECAHLLLESPSLIIADEAHRIKSATSIARKFFEKFTSPSRIALTGSPLANNLEEYWSMIDWVAPGYLGTPNEFKAYFVEPIQEGFYKESTRSDHRRALKCLTVLKREIEPKVNRADITVLKDELKSKIEFLIMVPLSKVQEDAYKTCVSHMWDTDVAEVSNARLWHWMHILTVLCNHPLAFRKRIKEKERAAGGADARRKKGKPVFEDEPEVEDDTETPAKTLSPALIADIEKLFNNTPHVGSPLWSYKTELLVRIIQNARDAGDKVLVFSQSIPTLDYLEMFLTHTSTISCVRLDGSTKMSERPKLLNQFNMGKFDAFLMSTRAGGIGFNLPAANRVVLFDYGFNPQHEEQAIGRAYRIGQQKEVFVYRFVVGGTFEPKVWNKALFKAQLASRVVDAKNPERRAEKMKDYLFPPEYVPQEDLSENRGKDPSVLDKLLDDMDAGRDLGIRAITTTETLMAEDKDADLDVTEMEEVELMMKKDGGVRKDNPATFGRMLEIQEQQRILQEKQDALMEKSRANMAHQPPPTAPQQPVENGMPPRVFPSNAPAQEAIGQANHFQRYPGPMNPNQGMWSVARQTSHSNQMAHQAQRQAGWHAEQRARWDFQNEHMALAPPPSYRPLPANGVNSQGPNTAFKSAIPSTEVPASGFYPMSLVPLQEVHSGRPEPPRRWRSDEPQYPQPSSQQTTTDRFMSSPPQFHVRSQAMQSVRHSASPAEGPEDDSASAALPQRVMHRVFGSSMRNLSMSDGNQALGFASSPPFLTMNGADDTRMNAPDTEPEVE